MEWEVILKWLPKLMQGALCNECGNHTVIRKDGCDFCTACGAVGTCG